MAFQKKAEGQAATEHLHARVTPAERALVETLVQRHAADLEAQGIPGDASFTAWFRWIIRREAKAAGLDGTGAPAAPQPAQSTPKHADRELARASAKAAEELGRPHGKPSKRARGK